MRRILALALAAAVSVEPAWAGLLTAQGIQVLDTSAVPRTTFSSNERIALTQQVNNGVLSANRVQYSFYIDSPAGAQVFRHMGNQAPGSVGNSAARISGVNISQFFTGPGVYTFRGEATLDGQTISQSKTFTVSSPNILLIYPPNGAMGLSDKPLTLRWTSSGAQRYRVTVGESPSMFNAVFSQETLGNDSFLSYPENPSDPRQNLSAGTVYYWKVEGLDASGNKIAESAVPFSFTVATSGSLTRDLALTELTITGKQSETSYAFKVGVTNQGGTSESNQQLKFSLGGLPAPGSPTQLPMMNPLDKREYTYIADFPIDQQQSLAIACVDFFDDNVANNCKTLNVTRAQAAAGDFGPDRPLTRDEIWEAIKQLLKEKGIALDDYALIGIDGTMSEDELQALLDQLRSGQGSFDVTGPTDGLVDVFGGDTALDGGGTSADILASEGSLLDSAEVWKALVAAFKRQGLDLSDYGLKKISKELDQAGLDALISALDKGRAQYDLSGPPPGELPPVIDETALTETTPAGAESEAAPEEARQEWSGRAVPLGEEVTTFEITSSRAWQKTWRRLERSEEVPKVTFKKDLIIGVMAGSRDKAGRIEILETKKDLSGLKVRYTLGEAEAGGDSERDRASAPYHLITIPNAGLEISFERVDRSRRRGKK